MRRLALQLFVATAHSARLVYTRARTRGSRTARETDARPREMFRELWKASSARAAGPAPVLATLEDEAAVRLCGRLLGELRRRDVGQQYGRRAVERLGVGVRRPLAPRCKPDVLERGEVAVQCTHIAARAEDAVYPVWGWFQGITVCR